MPDPEPTSTASIRSTPAATLPFFLLDVFTDTPFTGNTLAVFVDPGPLSDGQMQRIAAELHLSETVFIWSPARPRVGWRTRIFTPVVELPFAGHPTIGAALLVATLTGRDGGTGTVVLEEAVGDVEVEATYDGGGTAVTGDFLVPQPVVPVGTGAPDDLAAAVGLEAHDLHAAIPVRGYSAGVPFSIVPVVDADALARAQIDAARWAERIATTEAPHLYVVTPLDAPPALATRWRARMFAPAMGIAEDPATGAAAAAFAGYLDDVGDRPRRRVVEIEQGIEIARPSRINVRIERSTSAAPASIRIGGSAVLIGRGTLALPTATCGS